MAQQQHTPNLPVRETTTVEHLDEQPTPRLTLKIEALEGRVAPTVVPPNPGWGD